MTTSHMPEPDSSGLKPGIVPAWSLHFPTGKNRGSESQGNSEKAIIPA